LNWNYGKISGKGPSAYPKLQTCNCGFRTYQRDGICVVCKIDILEGGDEMKPRRVSIDLEIETDLQIKDLKDRTKWKHIEAQFPTKFKFEVIQVGVNVFKEGKK
jgi:hypothetical protein